MFSALLSQVQNPVEHHILVVVNTWLCLHTSFSAGLQSAWLQGALIVVLLYSTEVRNNNLPELATQGQNLHYSEGETLYPHLGLRI